MKKNQILIGIVVVVIVIVGGYAILHKSNKPTTSSTASTKSTSATALNNAVVVTKTNSSVGQYLADPSGKTLYTYAADTSGVSNCTGSCLASWPAYQDRGSATALPVGFGTIKRTDNGELQFTYNGMPLYFFTGDSSAGMVTGDGVSNFKVAKPSSSSSSSSSSTNNPPSSSPSSTPSY